MYVCLTRLYLQAAAKHAQNDATVLSGKLHGALVKPKRADGYFCARIDVFLAATQGIAHPQERKAFFLEIAMGFERCAQGVLLRTCDLGTSRNCTITTFSLQKYPQSKHSERKRAGLHLCWVAGAGHWTTKRMFLRLVIGCGAGRPPPRLASDDKRLTPVNRVTLRLMEGCGAHCAHVCSLPRPQETPLSPFIPLCPPLCPSATAESWQTLAQTAIVPSANAKLL